MNIQFKQGVIEFCILNLLLDQQLTGYSIEKTLSEQFRIPVGSIYPLLRQMTLADYIEAIIIEENHRKRKIFKITEQGKSERTKLNSQWNSLVHRVNLLIKEE